MSRNEKFLICKKYSSYNQITKEYDVYILSNEEYDKIPKHERKEIKLMVLKKKNKVLPPKPPKAPAWFTYWVENVYEKTPPAWFTYWVENVYKKDISDIKQEIKTIVQLNNLKTK